MIDLAAIKYDPAQPVCNCSEPDWCPTRRLDENAARHVVGLLLSGDWENAQLPAGRTLARYLDGFGLEMTITPKATP
jgi:hypothetical protein